MLALQVIGTSRCSEIYKAIVHTTTVVRMPSEEDMRPTSYDLMLVRGNTNDKCFPNYFWNIKDNYGSFSLVYISFWFIIRDNVVYYWWNNFNLFLILFIFKASINYFKPTDIFELTTNQFIRRCWSCLLHYDKYFLKCACSLFIFRDYTFLLKQ